MIKDFMKKRNIFSRVTTWSILLCPMFVACTQGDFIDEDCMYSTNASRLDGARMEITYLVSKAGSSTSDHLKLGNISVEDAYGIMTLSWPEDETFSSIDSKIRVDSEVIIENDNKYRFISKRNSRPTSHNWNASATCYASIEIREAGLPKDTLEVSFAYSKQIETKFASFPSF